MREERDEFMKKHFRKQQYTAGIENYSGMPSDHRLMDQATMTAEYYLIAGLFDIDHVLGKGYAAAHPDLLTAYMRVCASDFAVAQEVKYACRAALGERTARHAERLKAEREADEAAAEAGA